MKRPAAFDAARAAGATAPAPRLAPDDAPAAGSPHRPRGERAGARRSPRRSAARAARRSAAASAGTAVRSTLRRRRLVAVLAAVAVLVTASPVLLAVTPVFAVRRVVVTGATPATARALVSRLAPLRGTPLALVDQARVAAAVGAVPVVERYTVASLPPGTLEVRVLLRTPVLQARRDGGWALLDAAAVRLADSAERYPGVPELLGTGGASAREQAGAATTVLQDLPNGIREEVRAVSARRRDDVELQLSDGRRVVWGSVEAGAAKAAALRAALLRAARHAAVIDVSAPGLVSIR